MRNIFSIAIFLLIPYFGYSQSVFEEADTLNYPYKEWTKEEIQSTITTTNANYLSGTEKKIIILANLARINPNLFSKTFLLQYAASNDLLKNSYVKSLQKTLRRMKPLDVFRPDKQLYELAKSHAIYSGKRGSVGHQKFSKRAKKATYLYFAENCHYGYSRALDIYLDLFIDEGISDLGHRVNFLSSDTKFIGVSLQPHKKYEYNCVIDFGGN